ncbi:hypothetical protein [Petroclostridium sp. X23]|uniref:hypothetical protein n=1 Tax=Petroclostridium sp. X23 TaxID=3045146 RepID=UPI0024ADDE3D|nr:hypothetical protein [Petroclostridium sp. X23]WHH59350.1 hypothetical protein QKW49_00850 [Petroclostridium sp. X23]
MATEMKKVNCSICENCRKKDTCDPVEKIKDRKAIALYPRDTFRIIISCKDKNGAV